MSAIRLLVLFVLAYLVILIINVLFSSSKTTLLKRTRNPPDYGEELVLCLQCQSYVPKAEAVSAHGNYFCREECAQLFMKTHNEDTLTATQLWS
jgi:hypothetical protein